MIPQIGFNLTIVDFLAAFSGREDNFLSELVKYFNKKQLIPTGSGTAAFYLILLALKKKYPSRKEVILPAYTAPAMVLPVLKAGLKPVFGEISLDDFNLDLKRLPVSKNTLAIVPTHLFGIINFGVENLKDKYPETIIIEDCAQAMGSKLNGVEVGSFSDIAFYSFNRGKNLPTDGGGLIAADKVINIDFSKIESRQPKVVSIFFRMLLLSLAVRPSIYGMLYSFISQFKDNQVPKDFELKRYTGYQAGIGLAQLKRFEELVQKRYDNGMYLIRKLQNEKIILPKIAENSRPAFNRLPVLFKDLNDLDRTETALQKAGIDTSRMYRKPLHHIFDLGYKKEEFPNACFLAEHLVTLPTHPLVGKNDLERIVGVFKEVLT